MGINKQCYDNYYVEGIFFVINILDRKQMWVYWCLYFFLFLFLFQNCIIILFVQEMNDDDITDENTEEENTQSINIMDINSVDDDTASSIVTVKEEYQDVLL